MLLVDLELSSESFDALRLVPAHGHDVFMDDFTSLNIGVLGGTGPQGKGLGLRFAQAGHSVTLGSRDAARAASSAKELLALMGSGTGSIAGAGNAEAAAGRDLVVIAVPWDGHEATLRELAPELAGAVVVDCVNPMGFDAQGAFSLPVPEGSAAEQAATLLPDSKVVAAFHHVSAVLLLDPEVASVDTDVLVLGDDREATDLVAALASSVAGMRGIYGGRLRNAGQVEAFTANLISINRRYKAHAGLRITDV